MRCCLLFLFFLSWKSVLASSSKSSPKLKLTSLPCRFPLESHVTSMRFHAKSSKSASTPHAHPLDMPWPLEPPCTHRYQNWSSSLANCGQAFFKASSALMSPSIKPFPSGFKRGSSFHAPRSLLPPLYLALSLHHSLSSYDFSHLDFSFGRRFACLT